MNFKKELVILVLAIFFGEINVFGQHYISIAELEKICAYNKREDVIKLNAFLTSVNYVTHKLYANINTFEDDYGNSITTTIIDDERKSMEILYAINNPSESLINKYKNQLKINYSNVGFNEAGDYTKEGKFLFYIHTEESSNSSQDLVISVKNNSKAAYPVAAIKIKNSSKKKITSFTNSFSSLYVTKGNRYTLTATGSISLGGLAGRTGPNGIDGFEESNYVHGFKHGSLLGKLGKNGKWFLIGSRRTIKAVENTHLYVKVNDIDPSNNSGYFTFSHQLTSR